MENCGDAEEQNNRNEVKLNSTKPHTEGHSLIGQELFAWKQQISINVSISIKR